MRMKSAIVCLLGGLTLATLAGPASAQPVTYQVDLLFDKFTTGPRQIETVRFTMRAVSPQAAESMCASGMNMIRLGRNIMEKNPGALGLPGRWRAGGGQCVTNSDGNVVMTVEASGGSN
jgi:hypothetical protein